MGRVVAPYGVQGWLKVAPSTAAQDALLDYRQWWLRKRGEAAAWQEATLIAGRLHGSALVVQFAGLGEREAAAGYAGAEVGVPRSALPDAGAGEVYLADLVGLAVVNRAGEALGSVREVQEFGAHPVLRIVDDAGATYLVPFVAAYVDAVDVEGKRLEVDWQKDY